MIRQKTTFVLGAGASVPFDFPSGQGLRSTICKALRTRDSEQTATLLQLGHDFETLKLFANEFEHSGLRSIDRFLSLRPALAELGKQVITACLVRLQREKNLYSAKQDVSDWYGYLWNLMIANTPDEVVTENKIAFVTFNYDVSLEHFLSNAFRASFNLSEADAQGYVRRIAIHHVYGKLQLTGRWDYRPNLNEHELREIAKELKVVPADRPVADQLAQRLVTTDQVMFLGFGFDSMNCDRLGIVDARREMARRQTAMRIYGTVFGLKEGEIENAYNALGGVTTVQLLDVDCLELLRINAHQF